MQRVKIQMKWRIAGQMIVLLLLVTFKTMEAGENEDRLLADIEKAVYPEHITYTARMTIFRPGKEYKKTLKIYMRGDDKAVIEFLEPPREKNTRMLMIGENMWIYLPSAEKVIRISGNMKVMGGDFLYDDILRVRLTHDYQAKSIEERDGQKVFTLTAKEKTAAYKTIKFVVEGDRLLPVRSEFYTASGLLLKTLDYAHSGGATFPSSLLMQLAVSEDYKTEMEIIDYNDRPISNRIFTQEFLKKGL